LVVLNYDIRMDAFNRRQRGRAVVRLADDLEAFSLQQPPGQPPEPVVIIHDHQTRLHSQILAPSNSR
jgi:hypothetical protein